jgi:predicted Zn-dependent peptidase
LADAQQFHHDRYRPLNATFISIGELPSESSLLETELAAWDPRSQKAEDRLETTEKPAGTPLRVNSVSAELETHPGSDSSIHLVDRPAEKRISLYAAHLVPIEATEETVDRAAYDALRYALGGPSPSSRLARTLREKHQWAYHPQLLPRRGGEVVLGTRGPELLVAYTGVGADTTVAAMHEIVREWTQIQDDRPVTTEELSRIKRTKVLTLADELQTLKQVSEHIHAALASGLPVDEPERRLRALRRLSVQDVTEAARRYLCPDDLQWLVVGNAEDVVSDLRDAPFGQVEVVETEENPLVE